MIPIIFLLFPFIWVPMGDADDINYIKVPVIYGDIVQCGGYHSDKTFIKGCAELQPTIQMKVDPRFMMQDTYLGYNVWTHEVLHMWGYSHAEMLWWKEIGTPQSQALDGEIP
jgi:hypothetical protein